MDRKDEISMLSKTFEVKKAYRRNWDWQWEEIALYSMPGKADFVTQRTTGDPARNKEIYDPVAAVANHTLASHIHTAMTNPANPWFEMKYRDKEMICDEIYRGLFVQPDLFPCRFHLLEEQSLRFWHITQSFL